MMDDGTMDDGFPILPECSIRSVKWITGKAAEYGNYTLFTTLLLCYNTAVN